jgi:hypothetical protein
MTAPPIVDSRGAGLRLDWTPRIPRAPHGLHKLHVRVARGGPRMHVGWLLATPWGALWLRRGAW